MNQDDKELIANELEVQAENVRMLANNPTTEQRYRIVKELFDIMRQIVDL